MGTSALGLAALPTAQTPSTLVFDAELLQWFVHGDEFRLGEHHIERCDRPVGETEPVEMLSIFSKEGKLIHLRARPASKSGPATGR